MLADKNAGFTMTAFCTLENLKDMKLDPPRSAKAQAALVLISSVISEANAEHVATSFVLEFVEHLTMDEANNFVAVLKKLIYFTALANQLSSRKRKGPPLADLESQAHAAKCRSLGKHPTGADLPEYSSPTKHQPSSPSQS